MTAKRSARPAAATAPLLARYREVRAATLALTEGLSAEDMQAQSMPDASPVKWHLAHTTWFFETFLLKPLVAGYRTPDETYHYLFNSYYEAEGPRHPRPERGLLTRPSLDDVLAWRSHVDAAMAELLAGGLDAETAGLVDLGLHHDQQHQELILMDLKHLFSRNGTSPAYRTGPAPEPCEPAALSWTKFPPGLRQIGHDGEGFAFDNEGPRHRVFLEAFALADRPVTCGEWLEFIDDGGYARPELWLSDGWTTAQAEGWTAPLYWRGRNGERTIFTLAGERPLDPAEPVCHVSFYEADAYARWAGARLQTEAEWETAAGDLSVNGHFGEIHPRVAPGEGLGQMFGGVWEWTASPYVAYPRFRPAPGAVGEYNGKFMSGQMVLRGGACVTPPQHIRATYRNFFPPSARWAFAGLRLAKDV
ncbi:MAG: ergothioneine biosynthesis protein EgtB [Caulobacteraceae bacterium]